MAKKDDGKSKKKSSRPKSFLAHFVKKDEKETKPDWNKIGHEIFEESMGSVVTDKKFKTSKGKTSQVEFDIPESLKKQKKPLTEYNAKKKEACRKMREEQLEDLNRPKGPGGRPSIYNQEIADYIIDKIASTSCGLKTLCSEDPKMPAQDTVNMWRWKYPEFSERYLVAKQMQAHLLAEECEEIAADKHYIEDALGQKRVDPGYIASQRLRADTRRWHVAKLNPTYFGDKKLVDEMRNKNDELLAELQSIRAQLAEKNKKDY